MLFLVNTGFKKVLGNAKYEKIHDEFITGVLVRGCHEFIRKVLGGLLSMFGFVTV